jgi:psiF repeat
MLRFVALVATLAVVLPGPSSFALTAKDKMATCKFGADDQNLQGKARSAFIKKCMSNKDEPRGAAAAPPPGGQPPPPPPPPPQH